MTYQVEIDDYIGRWGYSRQYVRCLLKPFKGKHVDMRISSLGGDLGDGLDIRQQLKDHGDVTVYLTGFVASAATVIAMGAQRVCMSRYAMFLVHKCSNYIDAWGNYNADEMQQLIDDLIANKAENDRIDSVLAQMYADKCGQKVEDLMDLLKEGRWLTAQQALDYGFVDEIIEDSDDAEKTNLSPAMKAKLNMLDLPLKGIPTNEEEIDGRAESRSMLRQILDAVKSWGKSKDLDPEPINEPKTEPVMNTVTSYAATMAAAGVESFNVSEDGNIFLTEEQMQQIEDRLNSLASDVAERDNTINDLNQQVETLKKLPGDETTNVVETSEKKEMTSEEVFNFINDM